MANPTWPVAADTYDSFGKSARLVTPAGTNLDPIAKSIVMLAAGDITVIPAGSSASLAFTGLPAGYTVPFQVRQVTACSSTCATID